MKASVNTVVGSAVLVGMDELLIGGLAVPAV